MPIARNMVRYAAVSAACELSRVPSQSKRTPRSFEDDLREVMSRNVDFTTRGRSSEHLEVKTSSVKPQHSKNKKKGSAEALPSWLKFVTGLELKPNGQLRQARIANADAQEAVEVEQRRSRKRIDVVL